MFPPTRIVCLTEETVETLYLLGEEDRIVGISGYVVRPPQARREKPRVSAFTSANIDKILALKPDLVLTFSDLQANIVADLIRRGLNVHAFNQRSIAGILDMIRMVGAIVNAGEQADELVARLDTRLAEARNRAAQLPKRPRVFFLARIQLLIIDDWAMARLTAAVFLLYQKRSTVPLSDHVIFHQHCQFAGRQPQLAAQDFDVMLADPRRSPRDAPRRAVIDRRHREVPPAARQPVRLALGARRRAAHLGAEPLHPSNSRKRPVPQPRSRTSYSRSR